MAFEQKIKIWLTPFNPLWYQGALPDFDPNAAVATWTMETSTDPFSVGDTDIEINGLEDYRGYIIKFANHNNLYYVTDQDGFIITVDSGLFADVPVGTAVQIYHWTDITALQMSVSNLEKEIETDTYDFIFDGQVRFKAANYDDELYGRTAYKTAFDTAQAYFNTRNENDAARDNKYVRIEAYYNSVWNQIYSGKITDDMRLDVAEYEFEFETETNLYSLKDIYFDQVTDIFNNHKFTTAEAGTQTQSGKVVDIIWKMFREIGVTGKSYTASHFTQLYGIITITLPEHDIKAGELIHYTSPALTCYTNTYIVEAVTETTIQLRTKKFFQDYDYDEEGIIIATGVLFDVDYSKYFYAEQYNWGYDISDAWFIPQLWHKKLLVYKTCNDIMNMFCGWFGAHATIDYKSGRPYGIFRSKINHSASVLTLTKDDFIGEWLERPNWQKYSKDMVSAGGTATFFDGSTSDVGSAYYDDYQVRIKYSTIYAKGDTEIELESDNPFAINDVIRFQKHSTEYRVIDVDGATITLNQPLEQSLDYNEYVCLSNAHDISLEMPELFNIKLIYPDILAATEEQRPTYDPLQGWVHKYTNQGASITDYQDRFITCNDDTGAIVTMPKGITYLPTLPMYPMLSGQIFWSDTSVGYDRIYHGFYFESDPIRVYGISSHSSADHITGGYIEITDEDTKEVDIFPTFYTKLYIGSDTYLYRDRAELVDGGDYSQTNEYEHGLFQLENAATIQRFTSAAYNINGVNLHSDIIFSTKNDKIYFTAATGTVYEMLAYGSATESETFTGVPAHVYVGIHVGNYENSTTPAQVYLADRDDEMIMATPLNNAAWDGYSEAGGGLTALTAGQDCAFDDVLFDDIYGVWKCYDDLIIATDATGLYMLDNHESSTIYKLLDSVYLNDICAVDFVQVLMTSEDNEFFNIADNAAYNGLQYYSKRRREINCALDWDDYMAYELTIGDRVTLDSNVTKGQSGNVNYWVQKINLNLENRIINLTLLEDTSE